jgi:hypothetical protein
VVSPELARHLVNKLRDHANCVTSGEAIAPRHCSCNLLILNIFSDNGCTESVRHSLIQFSAKAPFAVAKHCLGGLGRLHFTEPDRYGFRRHIHFSQRSGGDEMYKHVTKDDGWSFSMPIGAAGFCRE